MVALPSLKGLQAFEAAARTGSFAAAAEELSAQSENLRNNVAILEQVVYGANGSPVAKTAPAAKVIQMPASRAAKDRKLKATGTDGF